MSRPTPSEDPVDRPVRASLSGRRTAVTLLLVVLAIAAAAFLIVWLPPSGDVKTEVKATVLEYELAREVAWPKGATIGLPLTPAQEHALAVTLRTRVSHYAAGDALAAYDGELAARSFADDNEVDPTVVLTNWKGEIVYFDFVRHTLPLGLIVRVGVLKAHRVGRVNAVAHRVFAGKWVWAESAEINEYALRQVDGAWRVVRVKHWGACGPEGEDVAEGPLTY